MWIIRNIERYYIMMLVIVNFASCRRSLLLFVKQNKSQLMSTGQCPGSNLSPLCLRLSFIPLSHWGNGVTRESWMTCWILYPFCWVASCSFISLYLLPVTAKFGGFPCRCLSPKLTKNAAALHFYSWKEHQLSREDLWILISQFFLGQTLLRMKLSAKKELILLFQMTPSRILCDRYFWSYDFLNLFLFFRIFCVFPKNEESS